MKIACSSATLLPALRTAARAASPRATMPILGAILLRAAGSRLRLAATDLEVDLETSCDAEVAEPGAAALPARLLVEVVGSLPAGQVRIDAAETSAVIAAGAARFELVGMAASDFPAMADPADGMWVRLSSAALLGLIRSTVFAASTDDTRPHLAGGLVTVAESTIRMAATDGSRLALHSAALDRPSPEAFAGIVPRRALGEAMRILDGADDAALSWTDNTLFLDTGSARLSSRLIAGTLPPYQTVLDQASRHAAAFTADRRALVSAVRRVAIASAQGANPVRLALDGSALTLTANAPDIGSAIEELRADITGGPTAIAFNARFLLDALEPMDAERVRLGIAGSAVPALLTPADAPEPLCVIAPVRVQD